MSGKEKMLSKAEIDEYIRLHYKTEKKTWKELFGDSERDGGLSWRGNIYRSSEAFRVRGFA